MAEAVLIIKNVPDGLATAEADIKVQETWSSVTEKHFIPYGQYVLMYAQGS